MVEKKNTEGLFGKLLGGRKKSRTAHNTKPEATAEHQESAVTRQPKAKVEANADKSVVAESKHTVAANNSAAADATPTRRQRVTKQTTEKPADSSAETEAKADAAQYGNATPVPDATLSLVFQAPVIPEHVSHHQNDDEQPAERQPRRRQRQRSSDRSHDTEKKAPVVNEPQKIKGSTRLEAKRQRRSQGREANRRRSSITETEFLARREAVDREMVVRSVHDRIQIGVLEDKVLVEHYVAKSQDQSLIGNVYLGRVQNVLPSMEAAFVDIGRGRNAVLYSGEVDWDAADVGGKQRRIELALKAGDIVLVQVTKDPVGHKGARLTSQISLPGRYLVFVPNGSMTGISRKLPESERSRLKKILKEIVPAGAGVIVRTAAEGATEEQLTKDVQRLEKQWLEIQAAQESSQAPALLHSEPDLLIKIVRDVFNEDFTKLIISGSDALATIKKYLEQVSPDLLDRVEEYTGAEDAFNFYRVNEQIQKALERKVWLPSGGSLVIDRTEAMTVIDVNTGKFVGSGGNLEETVTKNNIEAAEEIVRQLRLRDTGGIVVIDFIDMVLESNRDLVLRRLIECLGRDRTKHQVAEVTSLGLIQMTRKKIGIGLLESFSEPCEVCGGRGVVVHHDPVLKKSAPDAPKRKSRSHKQQPKHKLDDNVKQALAQVAASTLPKDAEAESGSDDKQLQTSQSGADGEAKQAVGKEDSHASNSDHRGRTATKAAGEVAAKTQPRRSRRARKDAAAPTNDPAKILLDFTEVKSHRPAHGSHEHDVNADKLLDSVLASLPEASEKPKQTRRSRRVTRPAGNEQSEINNESKNSD